MTTTQSNFATDKQVAFIEGLRQQKGEDVYAAAVKDLGCDTDPRHIRKHTASKLLDMLLDASPPVVTAAASIPAPIKAPSVEALDLPDVHVEDGQGRKAAIAHLADLTGKTFIVPGYGHYKVESDMGGFCTVVCENRRHAYQCPVLGERAVISRDNIARLVSA